MIQECGLSPDEETAQKSTPISGQDLRLVVLGGGTGLPVLLRGLKNRLFTAGGDWNPRRDRERLTAVVTVADDGGSSGRLRHAYRVLAPGDIRNCLLALSEAPPTLQAIFRHRLTGQGEIAGHSLGNLILTALSQVERSFQRAVERAGEILQIRGTVLPSTRDEVTLIAEFMDGSRVIGESVIASLRRPIHRVDLLPSRARALPATLEAIRKAHMIVIGPGSLYTSLIPVVLVREIAEAIALSYARVVLVMNLMSEPGETDGYNAADIILALRRHAPQVTIQDVLVNTAPLAPDAAARYAAGGSLPIAVCGRSLWELGCRPMERDLLSKGPEIRHDPDKLAGAVLELAEEMPQRVTLPWRAALPELGGGDGIGMSR